MEITCPSGLRVRLRKLKTKAVGAVFAGVGGQRGRRRPSRAARLDPLLDFAVTDVLEPGIYRWKNGRPILKDGDWQDVLSGDRVYILLKARQKTFGSHYVFRTQCSSTPCRAPIAWDIDIDELEVTELNDESKRKFLAGEPFEFDVEGTTLLYHLGTGRDEGRVPRDVDPLTSSVLSRVHQVGETRKFAEVREFVEDIDADVLDEIRAEMEVNDCGVETSFEIECQECGTFTTIELPFDKTFFMPKSGAPRRYGRPASS